MEILSLTVLKRRNVTTNQVELIDIDDIASPITEVNGGSDSAFTLREGKKGPFPNQPTNTDITPYVVDETLAQISAAAGTIFVVTILTYKGRTYPLGATPSMAFNAKFIAARVIPYNGGSKFMYQEDSDPDLVEYTCSETPAAILAQITSNSSATEWLLNGNLNASEKYIGTNNNYDFPVRANGVEIFRFKADGTIKYPNSPGIGYILTSDGAGVGTWQAPSGVAPSSSLDPVISRISNPPGGPVAGDRYLVLSPGTGAWAGHNNEVAEWDGATWQFTIPALDDYIYVTNTLTTLRWNGIAWIVVPGIAILQNGNTLGAAGVRVGSNDAFPLWLKTNNTLRVRIDGSTGGVRISSSLQVGYLPTAPTARFQILSAGSTMATYAIKVNDSTANPIFYLRDDGKIESTTSLDAGSGLTSYHHFSSTTGAIGIFLDSFDNIHGYSTLALGYGGVKYCQIATSGPTLFIQTSGYILFRDASNAVLMTVDPTAHVLFTYDPTALESASARVHIIGEASTSATYALKVQNKIYDDILKVRDDGRVFIGSYGYLESKATLSPGELYIYGANQTIFDSIYPTQVIIGTGDLMKNTIWKCYGGGVTGNEFEFRGFGASGFASEVFTSDTGTGEKGFRTMMGRTAIAGDTNFSHRFINGNVMIGADSDALAKLHIFDSTQGILVGNNTGAAYANTAAFGLGATYGVIGFKNATDLNNTSNWLWDIREDSGAGLLQLWRSGTIVASFSAKSGALANRMLLKNDAGSSVFIVNSATGQINTPLMQIGNAGLVTGDMYIDTAANILANGDKVVGWKV